MRKKIVIISSISILCIISILAVIGLKGDTTKNSGTKQSTEQSSEKSSEKSTELVDSNGEQSSKTEQSSEKEFSSTESSAPTEPSTEPVTEAPEATIEVPTEPVTEAPTVEEPTTKPAYTVVTPPAEEETTEPIYKFGFTKSEWFALDSLVKELMLNGYSYEEAMQIYEEEQQQTGTNAGKGGEAGDKSDDDGEFNTDWFIQ